MFILFGEDNLETCFLCCDNIRCGRVHVCSNCAKKIKWSKLKESVGKKLRVGLSNNLLTTEAKNELTDEVKMTVNEEIKQDTTYRSRVIRRIGNWSNALSCKVEVLVRRIFLTGYGDTAVKTSAGYNWRNSSPNSNCDSGPTFIRTVIIKGNKDQLEDFEEFNGGSVTFGGSKGYITGKGRIRVG
ncbi:hypothetical protein Tco_0366429 [Tanacetum coccineum]